MIFACETEQECNDWMETINKILSGVDLSNEEGWYARSNNEIRVDSHDFAITQLTPNVFQRPSNVTWTLD